MPSDIRRRWAETAYRLLPLALTGVQALWTWRSTTLLRFEEVAEGARNAWWLDHHALFDGISTNVGWYGSVLAAYTLFGFSLFTAKWLKLALYAGAVSCLAWLLRRPWRSGRDREEAGPVRPGQAAVPLMAIGLSPSILYFGTVGTSFGTDLLYLPYLLAILAVLRERRRSPSSGASAAGLGFAFGAVAMLAWTSYPVFVFYLPALALAYITIPAGPAGGPRALPGLSLRAIVPALAGFLTPLLIAASWLGRPARLFYDPETGSGIFRGGGTGFDFAPATIARHAGVALHDLFVRGTSYYYWVERPDLAGPLGLAAFLAVAGGSLALFLARPTSREETPGVAGWRTWIVLAWTLPALELLAVSAGTGPQGLRRATGLLAGFYFLFVLVWRATATRLVGGGGAPWGERLARFVATFLLLLPLHHLVAAAEQYPHLPLAGEAQTHLWLRIRPTADESLAYWLDRTAAGDPLDCRELGLAPERCQYGGIYALLSGHRHWNGAPEVPLRAWDYGTGRYEELSIESLSGEFSR